MSNSAGFRWLIALCLGVPLLLVCLSAWVSYDALVSTRASARWLVGSFEVRATLLAVLSDIQDVETGQRGFVLTGQPAFLDPCTAATPRIPRRLAALRALLAGQPGQREKLDRLEQLTNEKLAHVDKTIALEKEGGHAAALELIGSGYGQARMDAIREIVARIRQDEDQLLVARETSFAARMAQNRTVTVGVVVVQLAFIALVGALLWHLARLQRFVTVCAWSRTIQYEGEWISYDEYLRRRFGIEVTHGVNPAEARRLLAEFREQMAKAKSPGGGASPGPPA